MIRDSKLSNFTERVLYNHTPITADVFLTDYCNNHCSYCRYRDARTGHYMEYNDFVHYVLRLRQLGVRGIILTGGGEPTINPHFDRICSWLEANGIDYGINTNLNVLKYIKPNFLKVSLDASTSQEYKAIRGVDGYDKVLNNIKEYSQWKTANSPHTVLGVQCIALSVRQVWAFYYACADLGVDYIQYRPLETHGQPMDYTKLLEALKIISGLKGPKVVISPKFKLTKFRADSCAANWSVITIDTHGNVPYCCHRPNEIIGHILDDDILQRLRCHQPDMSACEVPCRLSMANSYLSTFTKENDINFV